MRGTAISIVCSGIAVWVLVTAARRTDAPWWKVWLLGRGMFPTDEELRQAEEREKKERQATSGGPYR
jgi:hypothetical protein